MSYVDTKQRSGPTGMAAAVIFNGSIILAVALSPLVIEPRLPGGITVGRPIPIDPPPEPEMPKEQKAAEAKPIFAPKPINDRLQTEEIVTTTNNAEDSATVIDGAGGGDEAGADIVPDTIKPLPIFEAARRDPRFARSFQPDYPQGMLRLEIEGTVTVRVLVGTDGRVRHVQVLTATQADFARATERQALRAWRFKPATRDGEPVEDCQTLTVRFDIN